MPQQYDWDAYENWLYGGDNGTTTPSTSPTQTQKESAGWNLPELGGFINDLGSFIGNGIAIARGQPTADQSAQAQQWKFQAQLSNAQAQAAAQNQKMLLYGGGLLLLILGFLAFSRKRG